MSVKKRFLLGKEARAKMLEGAKAVYDLVSPTSGPKGRNIAYARQWGLPRIINDGIEIAKEVGSEDDYVNAGIDLIREAAQNTVTEAGDGTTTSIILAYETLLQACAAIDNEKNPANPIVLRTQIMDALNLLLETIGDNAIKVNSEEELRRVALISSSGDKEIADVVAHAVHEMGIDGVVTAEESNGLTITSEITKGLQLNKGYIDPMFVTDDMRMESVVVDPAIIVFEKTVTSQAEIVPIMNEISKKTKNVVIFGDIQGDAKATLILNKMRGVFQILAVNPPGYQEQRLAVLNDIAAVTGAKVITAQTSSFSVADAGGASHVSANKTTTTIVEGRGAQTVVEQRVNEIRQKKDVGDLSLYEKEKYEERLGKLTAGVALIKVGSKSDTLKREKFEKVKDAIGATKAALQEGVVPGGGKIFMEMTKTLMEKKDRNQGERILADVLMAPTLKLLMNAGKEIDEINRIFRELDKSDKNTGFNVNTDKVENLVEAGVLDPLKVVRLAFENAILVATSMFTAEGLIIDAPPANQVQQ